MESRRSRAKGLGGIPACVAALVAALVLTIAPTGAQAATPILEFASPGHSFPIPFETEGSNIEARLNNYDRIVECDHAHGHGEVTGPTSTVSSYVFTGCQAEVIGGGGTPLKCASEFSAEEEIKSAMIDAEPVYLDQADHKVAMLLNPAGGVYMEFACEGPVIKASGSFLAPVDPVNQLASSFTTKVERNGTGQIIKEYEDLNGVKHTATPIGQVGSESPANNGIALEMAIAPSSPLEIKAISRGEVETKQRADEEAAAKKKQEEDAAKAAADKKRQEEQAAKDAAAKKLQEEEAAKQLQVELLQKQRAQAKKRTQQRIKALKQCRKLKTSEKRTRCETRVKKKFSAPKKAHSMRVARF